MGAERISEGTLKQALRRSPARKALVWSRHRSLGPRDVFIASFPRSGNTWLRFVLSALVRREPSTYRSVEEVAPGVGYHRQAPRVTSGGGRLIKTHEPYRREYRRAIYLVRDVRAVAVSEYRVLTITKFPELTLDGFVDKFVAGKVDGYGTWEDHVRSWTADLDPTAEVLVIRYEDMRADPLTHVTAAAEFAGLESSPEQVASALDTSSLESMRAREMVDYDWGVKRLGWQLSKEDIGRSLDWRAMLTEQHLARLRPAWEMLSRFGYQT
jgi:hypothetical protein